MRYAILVDGGFAIKKLQKQLKSFPTATDLETEFSRVKTHPHLAGGELLRVYFYHAPPCTQTLTNPMSKATIDLSATVQFSQHKSLIDGLEMCDDVSVRLGETVARGWQLGSAAKKSLLNGTKSGIVANDLVGEAFRLARLEMAEENKRVGALRDRLLKGLSQIEETFVNGDMVHRVPHNLNISFAYVEGESLIMAIKDIAVSSGSACTSASLEPSYVLRALGRNDELAHSSIRFTIGRFTTDEEIDYTIDLLQRKVGKLRELSPLWDMFKEGIDLDTVQWAAH